MKIWQEIPKRGYVSQPTPLEELVRFSEKAGVRVRIKRDDLLPLGGNKIRKLDYLMEEAVRAGADTIITTSTNQCCLPQQHDGAAGCQRGNGLPGDYGVLGRYALPL